MSHIEVLPNSSSHATPGWAYVVDTGYSSTNVASKPSGVRKRGGRDLGAGRADVSSRQNNAILRHLAELDRENHKEVHIPIPAKQKDGAGRSTKAKTTTNVRRILMSQKTFKNYLDDEEAALAQAPSTAPRPSMVKTIRTSAASPRASAPATPKADQGPESHLPRPVPPSQPHVAQLIASEFDNDPLLRSYIPSAPSERIMQALLSEPPLSYAASRATLAAGEKPPRHFCSICGYWGRIKCVKCNARTCGLDCYRIHEETRCDRFYA